jgi:non-specific serine/threonine protein kinase
MTATATTVRCRFGRFELQPEERLLLDSGTPVRVGPHAFDLLVALVEHSGRLVTKDELLERIWPKVIVEENTLQVHVSALRKTLGADAIATVSGRGYRFMPAVIHVSAVAGKPAATPKDNLPHALTTFIGREKEIAELLDLLGTNRLLTLTGAGGCGKTRLAIQVAARVRERFGDGAWLVELASLTDPGLIPKAVANAVGVKERPGKSLTETIGEHVAQRSLLLVLDNAEHLLEASALLANALLTRCGNLVILATSRERLGIIGEATYRVPSLSMPESERLFADRARLQQPRFEITKEGAAALASICRRLDGIALAIELAAVQVRSLSVEELSARLDERFGLLVGGSRAALPRHRTLRSMMDWSYELLAEDEKTMLRRVSVFSGGWTLEAAEQVCGGEGPDGGVLELLASLADKSLVVAEASREATRYRLLETVRHYARDHLRDTSEEAPLKRAHLAHFVALAEEADRKLHGADMAAWLDRLEMDHENVRAALSFAAASPGDAPGGMQLAGAAWRFWMYRGYFSEGRAMLAEQLAQPADPAAEALRARCLHGAANLARLVGDLVVARKRAEESLAIRRRLGDRRTIAISVEGLGLVLWTLGENAAARDCYQESLAIYRELGLQVNIGNSLHNLGIVQKNLGDIDGARALYEQALALRRAVRDPSGIGNSLHALAEIAHLTGSFASARALFDEGLAIYKELGDQRSVASASTDFAAMMCDQGDEDGASALLRESLATAMKLGDRSNACSALRGLGNALSNRDPATAATLWGAVERMEEEQEEPPSPEVRARTEAAVARARAALGDDDAFDFAWSEGRAMSVDQAAQYALEIE